MKSDGSAPPVYELVRSRKRRKTLALHIERDGTVTLRVPFAVSREEADRFFREKEGWVRKKLAEREERRDSDPPERTFLAGDRFFFHGESYPLEFAETGTFAPLVLSRGVFILRPDRVARARDLFIAWYKEQARREFAERVRHYGGRFDLLPTGLTITSARTRYGSCSAANRVSLSWRLIMAPYPAIDYVILHELAHIRVKNHSARFWKFLETILPDYRTQRRWLRENSHLLTI